MDSRYRVTGSYGAAGGASCDYGFYTRECAEAISRTLSVSGSTLVFFFGGSPSATGFFCDKTFILFVQTVLTARVGDSAQSISFRPQTPRESRRDGTIARRQLWLARLDVPGRLGSEP